MMPTFRSASKSAQFSPLEPRLVLAATAASSYDQFMLELINRARANPAAEASRLGVQLNEGVTGTQISTAAKQPLVMNPFLVGAIQDHVTWLRANSLFKHEGSGGTSPQQRMASSGFTFGGSAYGSAENIGLTLGTSLGDLSERVETIYKNLFVDAGIAGRGHRTNLLNGSMEEVGIGVASGPYTYQGQNWTGIIAGQDFAYSSAGPWLTGVVYDDNLSPNDFYSPGEGKDGFTITATSSTGVVSTATSDFTGAYKLQLSPGTYTVTSAGPGAAGTAKFLQVVVGSENVKRDFEFAQFSGTDSSANALASISGGTLNVSGTTKSDRITVFLESSNVAVQVGDTKLTFAKSAIQRISVKAGTGNDYVVLDSSLPSTTIFGGDGNDTLFGTSSNDLLDGGDDDDQINGGGGNDSLLGGAGNDSLNGEGGKDVLRGGDGNDRLQGAGGNDILAGDANDDRLYGGDGVDQLDGGGNIDRLYGEGGNDIMYGGGSNDRMYGGDGDDEMWGGRGRDYFEGGLGTNRARDRESIESVLNVTTE